MFENCKGELHIALSAWWFFVIFLIAGGIVIATAVFYSTDVDVKWLEADILAERILDCVVNNGELVEGVFDDGFYSLCGLDRDKFSVGSNYFFKVWVDDSLKIGGGDYSIEKNCGIKEKVGTIKYFPICSERKAVILDADKSVKIHVLAGSNQVGIVEAKI